MLFFRLEKKGRLIWSQHVDETCWRRSNKSKQKIDYVSSFRRVRWASMVKDLSWRTIDRTAVNTPIDKLYRCFADRRHWTLGLEFLFFFFFFHFCRSHLISFSHTYVHTFDWNWSWINRLAMKQMPARIGAFASLHVMLKEKIPEVIRVYSNYQSSVVEVCRRAQFSFSSLVTVRNTLFFQVYLHASDCIFSSINIQNDFH